MQEIFEFRNLIMSIAALALMAVKVWAFVDAMLRPAEAYDAAGKLTKPAWLVILGITAVWTLIDPSVFGLISMAGTIAAFVYILDVRPALVSVTRRE